MCLAAALDHQELVDVLYQHGSTLGADDDVLNASVELIAVRLPVSLPACAFSTDACTASLTGCMAILRVEDLYKARQHCQCRYGDVFGSTRVDCVPCGHPHALSRVLPALRQ